MCLAASSGYASHQCVSLIGFLVIENLGGLERPVAVILRLYLHATIGKDALDDSGKRHFPVEGGRFEHHLFADHHALFHFDSLLDCF